MSRQHTHIHTQETDRCAQKKCPLARKLRQTLLVLLHSLSLFLPLQVLLRRYKEKGHLAALRARAADVFLRPFTLAPRAEALCTGMESEDSATGGLTLNVCS